MEAKVLRKQIYLPEEYEEQLKEISIVMDVTESSIIREALAEYLKKIKASKKKNTLYDLIGLCNKGKKDASINHDKYLY